MSGITKRTKRPNAPLAAVLLMSGLLLAACGGGGNGEAEDPFAQDSAETLAEQKFDTIAAAATVVHSAFFACESNKPDCLNAQAPAEGGDVVGKDLVMAINDPSTAQGAAIFRRPAMTPPGGTVPPLPERPGMPDLPGVPPPPPDDDPEAQSARGAHAQALPAGAVRVVRPTNARAQRVKVFAVYEDEPSVTHVCSGTLIDSSWVVTAGHCVANPDTGDKRRYAQTVWIAPGYGDPELNKLAQLPDEPYGRTYAGKVLVHERWWEERNFSFDIGWFRLRRPVGGFHGYHQMVSSACNTFTGSTFTTDAYPSSGGTPYPGVPSINGKRMFDFKYSFDECNGGTNNRATAYNFESFSGASGSGATLAAPGTAFGGTVHGVLSTTSATQNTTTFVRFSSAQVSAISSDIFSTTPAGADLTPVSVRITGASVPATNVPLVRTGDSVYLIAWFHNAGMTAFSGQLRYTAYVSTKDAILSSAHAIGGTHSKSVFIAPKGSAVDTPQIVVPCRPKGASQNDVVYIGVLVDRGGEPLSTYVNNNSVGTISMPVRIQGSNCTA